MKQGKDQQSQNTGVIVQDKARSRLWVHVHDMHSPLLQGAIYIFTAYGR